MQFSIFNFQFSRSILFVLIIIIGVLMAAVVVYQLLIIPPVDFPVGRPVQVKEGLSLEKISSSLKEEKVIRSRFLFEFFVRLIESGNSAKAGDYFFEQPESVFGVAKRISRAEFGLEPTRITIPEGFTLQELAEIFSKQFYNFNEKEFNELTENLEGFLFPDTYFFLPNVKAPQIIAEMRDNFNAKITLEIQKAIKNSGRSLFEIITMASMIEKEARDKQTRRIVSGILWKRLDIGMLLQVDAVFLYINGKNTFQLTYDDLKIDSLYNTYLYKGLPVGPIANPGLDAIMAAIYPEESDYWFYLSDMGGKTHYAATFAQHKINKAKYLD